MSIDLKIERFGVELVNRLFVDYKVVGFTPHPLTDYEDVESELNDDIVNAVKVHTVFFHTFYDDVYETHYEFFINNEIDLLQTILMYFPHLDLGENTEEVMSKFISSCAFVLDLCMIGIKGQDSNFLNKIHLIWAMFVDIELKDEFYCFGGWKELRRSAWKCQPVWWFVKNFENDQVSGMEHNMYALLQSVFRFMAFAKGKPKESSEPLALQWIDFVVKDPKSPLELMEYVDLPDLEWALKTLKGLVDPLDLQDIWYEKVIGAAESIGIDEKHCMDSIANRDFRKHPELYDIFCMLQTDQRNKYHHSYRNADEQDVRHLNPYADSIQNEVCKNVLSEMSLRKLLGNEIVESFFSSENVRGLSSSPDHKRPENLDSSSAPSSQSSLLQRKEVRSLQEESLPEDSFSQTLGDEQSQTNQSGLFCPGRYWYDDLVEALQRKFPGFSTSMNLPITVPGPEVITLSKLFSVLQASAEKRTVGTCEGVMEKSGSEYASSSSSKSSDESSRNTVRGRKNHKALEKKHGG